jgi:hypothetical protein
VKVLFESTSQEEFDEKRVDLIKAIAGSRLKATVRNAKESRPLEAKKPVYQAQKEMLDDLDANFFRMLKEIKREINEVIE